MIFSLSGLPIKTLNALLLAPLHATCSAYLNPLNLITRITTGEQYRSLSSSLRGFLHSPLTSSLLGPNILLNTLFSNILSLRSSLNVSDQVSHPYKTTGKIIVQRQYCRLLKKDIGKLSAEEVQGTEVDKAVSAKIVSRSEP